MKRILTTLSQKWPEYLLEMIVITAGILGAFMLNSWHEENKGRLEGEDIARNLNTEFKKNQIELVRLQNLNERTFQVGIDLMELVGLTKQELVQHNIDSLLFYVLEVDPYIPSQYSLSDLSNSGRLQLLQNDSLKELIYEWQGAYGQMREEFKGLDVKVENDLVPYLVQNYSMKNLDRFGPLAWSSKSKLAIDKYAIFQDIVFENQLDDLLYRIKTYGNALNKIYTIQAKVIEQTGNL